MGTFKIYGGIILDIVPEYLSIRKINPDSHPHAIRT